MGPELVFDRRTTRQTKFQKSFQQITIKVPETPLCNTRITFMLLYCGSLLKAFSNIIYHKLINVLCWFEKTF